MLFRNKIGVRVELPSSPFFIRQLRSLPPTSVDIETLCWKLSRQHRIACFPQSTHIFIIYKMAQCKLVDRAIEELADSLPNIEVDVEEELHSASLIVKAVEIGLRCVMLDNEWICVGDNTFINSRFGLDDERTPLSALNVQLQPDIADGCLFLIAPEGLRFNRLKISDILASDNMSKFAHGEKIEVQNLVSTCFVIPSLCEGHIIGVSKLLPSGENVERQEQLWFLKYGLALPSSYFAFIQLAYSGWTKRQWFPSSYVLQGLGFSSAPQSVRTLKAVCAFESFTKILEDWNFFSDGVVKVKQSCVPGIDMECPVWETAGKCMGQFNSNNPVNKPLYEDGLSAKDLLLTLDFRTPKPDRLSLHNKETKDADKEHAISLSMAYVLPNKPDYCDADMLSLSPQMPPSLVKKATGPVTTYAEVKLQQVLIPSFTKRKPREAHKGLASPKVKRQQVMIPSFFKGRENEANGDLTSPSTTFVNLNFCFLPFTKTAFTWSASCIRIK